MELDIYLNYFGFGVLTGFGAYILLSLLGIGIYKAIGLLKL